MRLELTRILGASPQVFGDDARKAMQDAAERLGPEVVGRLKSWHRDNHGVDIR